MSTRQAESFARQRMAHSCIAMIQPLDRIVARDRHDTIPTLKTVTETETRRQETLRLTEMNTLGNRLILTPDLPPLRKVTNLLKFEIHKAIISSSDLFNEMEGITTALNLVLHQESLEQVQDTKSKHHLVLVATIILHTIPRWLRDTHHTIPTMRITTHDTRQWGETEEMPPDIADREKPKRHLLFC